jgi:hypothetical protein
VTPITAKTQKTEGISWACIEKKLINKSPLGLSEKTPEKRLTLTLKPTQCGAEFDFNKRSHLTWPVITL